VYQLDAGADGAAEISRALAQTMDLDTDRLLMLPICRGCQDGIVRIGQQRELRYPPFWLV
jgi:hypothetical protein